ncbi:hypothetical protein B0T25DRAFT_320959 [Lasiosphaeria hispida]|uniref:Uncharacterized protein n=1 Tax=Lasiosphaeria hispida TaxID=260671 RepID=A0AAJ0H9X0_9PEZI|nr:hypothetical protein B0T25DRAFT_320959 [Lasiosphaeria hispida]
MLCLPTSDMAGTTKTKSRRSSKRSTKSTRSPVAAAWLTLTSSHVAQAPVSEPHHPQGSGPQAARPPRRSPQRTPLRTHMARTPTTPRAPAARMGSPRPSTTTTRRSMSDCRASRENPMRTLASPPMRSKRLVLLTGSRMYSTGIPETRARMTSAGGLALYFELRHYLSNLSS